VDKRVYKRERRYGLCELMKLPKSKHGLGYTEREVLDIIKKRGIHHKTFWKKFGVNTCAMHPETKESLYYGCDIERTIRCCKEKRDIYWWEFD